MTPMAQAEDRPQPNRRKPLFFGSGGFSSSGPGSSGACETGKATGFGDAESCPEAAATTCLTGSATISAGFGSSLGGEATAASGFLFKRGALDFAGGTVVHINAAVAGLVGAWMVGKRLGHGHEAMRPHNLPLTMTGASILSVGWFGFNAGSAVTANLQAGMAMGVTKIATATAAFTWMLVEWGIKDKPSVVGICCGAVAGLVAITPASGFVGPVGALCIGAAAGVLCYWGATGLKKMLGVDDALDVFGVHAVGGAAGAILTGVFAVSQYGGTSGLIEGNSAQLLNQVGGVLLIAAYDAVVTFIILYLVQMFCGGLRVSAAVERDGLDKSIHGEVVQ